MFGYNKRPICNQWLSSCPAQGPIKVNVKLPVCLIKLHAKMRCATAEVQFNELWDGVIWSQTRLCRLNPVGWAPGTNWIGGSRARLDSKEWKVFSPPPAGRQFPNPSSNIQPASPVTDVRGSWYVSHPPEPSSNETSPGRHIVISNAAGGGTAMFTVVCVWQLTRNIDVGS